MIAVNIMMLRNHRFSLWADESTIMLSVENLAKKKTNIAVERPTIVHCTKFL